MDIMNAKVATMINYVLTMVVIASLSVIDRNV